MAESLVEMAVIVPLLLFIFLGLMEVGWAIRGYLILLTTNRETARFAARGDFLNFDGIDLNPATVGQVAGYSTVLSHTYEVLESNELGVDLDDTSDNGAFIMSHYYIDTGMPCQPVSGSCLTSSTGDCRDPVDRRPDYTGDDLILYPDPDGVTMAGYDHFIFSQGMSTTVSQIDPIELARQLKEDNDALNCAILQRGATNPLYSINSLIVVEAFYEQPQLLGVPFISNTFTDPIPLYNQTKMRISTAKFPQGAGCELLPVALSLTNLNNYDPGELVLNIWNGGGNPQYGWLRWNSNATSPIVNLTTDSQPYLQAEIQNLRLAIHDYVESGDSTDTVLNAGDKVAGISGDMAAVEGDIQAIVGTTLTVPVWSSYSGGVYTIAKFVRVRIEDALLSGPIADRFISAVYIDDDINRPLTEIKSGNRLPPP